MEFPPEIELPFHLLPLQRLERLSQPRVILFEFLVLLLHILYTGNLFLVHLQLGGDDGECHLHLLHILLHHPLLLLQHLNALTELRHRPVGNPEFNLQVGVRFHRRLVVISEFIQLGIFLPDGVRNPLGGVPSGATGETELVPKFVNCLFVIFQSGNLLIPLIQAPLEFFLVIFQVFRSGIDVPKGTFRVFPDEFVRLVQFLGDLVKVRCDFLVLRFQFFNLLILLHQEQLELTEFLDIRILVFQNGNLLVEIRHILPDILLHHLVLLRHILDTLLPLNGEGLHLDQLHNEVFLGGLAGNLRLRLLLLLLKDVRIQRLLRFGDCGVPRLSGAGLIDR